MSYGRLGDWVGPVAKRTVTLTEKVAESIFPVHLDPADIPYLCSSVSGKENSRYGFDVHVREGFDEKEALKACRIGPPDLGPFETMIADKLITPEMPVLIIVGAHGCGKSTFIRYLRSSVLMPRDHLCQHEKLCGTKRFNEILDFNAIPDLESIEMDDRAEQRLLEILTQYMENTLADIVGEAEEYGAFISFELKRLDTAPSKLEVFVTMKNRLRRKFGNHDWMREDGEGLDFRHEVESDLEKKLHFKMAYLSRLWAYALRTKYGNSRVCLNMILDNFDQVSVVVQCALLRLVLPYSVISESEWILLLRPETFYRSGVDTIVRRHVLTFDREPYLGTKPYDLVQRRLKQFVDEPDPFFETSPMLRGEQRTKIHAYLASVADKMASSDWGLLERFFDATCGFSCRNALIIANRLLDVQDADLADPGTTLHDIMRLLVTGKQSQFRFDPSDRIDGLFAVHEASQVQHALLVKPRILSYLSKGARNCQRTLGEVRTAMWDFGYSNDVIRQAVNDLVDLPRQLVYSGSYDSFDPRKFAEQSGAVLVLSQAGQGYKNFLMKSLEYIQEVMLDAHVELEGFGREKVPYSDLHERLRLTIRFLRFVCERDAAEMERFKSTSRSDAFRRDFGEKTLGDEIVTSREFGLAFHRLVGSKSGPGFRELESEYADLVRVARLNTATFLG